MTESSLREEFLEYVASYVPDSYYVGANKLIATLGEKTTLSLIKLFKEHDNEKIKRIYYILSLKESKAIDEGKFITEKFELTLAIVAEAYDWLQLFL